MYLEDVPEDEPLPLAVESRWQMPLVDPTAGEGLGVPLLGITDLVLVGPEGALIVDFTTAVDASTPVAISHELQLSSYSLLSGNTWTRWTAASSTSAPGWTCVLTTLLLTAFHLFIDVLGHRRWAFMFIVLGVNSIAIYMMAHMFDFRLVGNIVVGGVSDLFAAEVRDIIQAVAVVVVMWLLVYWSYRTKTFIKI